MADWYGICNENSRKNGINNNKWNILGGLGKRVHQISVSAEVDNNVLFWSLTKFAETLLREFPFKYSARRLPQPQYYQFLWHIRRAALVDLMGFWIVFFLLLRIFVRNIFLKLTSVSISYANRHKHMSSGHFLRAKARMIIICFDFLNYNENNSTATIPTGDY